MSERSKAAQEHCTCGNPSGEILTTYPGRCAHCKKPVPTIYKTGGGWGDRIEWIDWPKRKVAGWKRPRPVVGDELQTKMESGAVARFRFVDVEYCVDPPDMFFGTVEDIGHAD